MNLILCNCNCKYQNEGYCNLDKAVEITNDTHDYKEGCLHFVKKEKMKKAAQNSIG